MDIFDNNIPENVKELYMSVCTEMIGQYGLEEKAIDISLTLCDRYAQLEADGIESAKLAMIEIKKELLKMKEVNNDNK